MRSKLSIRTRIVGTFCLCLVVMAAIGFYSYIHLADIEKGALSVQSDAVPGLYRASQIKDELAVDYVAVKTSARGDGIGSGNNVRAQNSHEAEMARLIADYKKTISTDADRQAFAKFETAYAGYRISAAALSSGNVDRAYQDAFDAIESVSALNQERAISMLTDVDHNIRALLTFMAGGFIFALFLLMLSAYRLIEQIMPRLKRLTVLMDAMRQGDFTQRMRTELPDELGAVAEGFNRMADEVMDLVGQVQRSGIRVSTSMTEIAATSKQQQATATEVAATTTQIGATSREIAATSKELVRTINDVATVAEHAAGLATSGQSGLSHMEETMGRVMDAAGSISAKLAVLNEKAGDINQVVTTITKVADQTNLLSLNAAIEAEKAGEYGRGFAVVSSEIRRLADQTAVATYDIEQMVGEIQSAVSAGVMGMDKFSEEVRRGLHDMHEIGAKLSEIISQVLTLVPRFETVNEGMQAQATGAEQISEALLQLTEATQQTVESLRQSSTAIDELNQVSGNLHGSIARFKLVAA
jgi:methyl-accepting chemotaxis protein WspA